MEARSDPVTGSGHVMLPLLDDAVVGAGWVSQQAFLACSRYTAIETAGQLCASQRSSSGAERAGWV